MIEKCMENWHKHLRGELEGGLDALLDDDCVFYSPIVFTPQKGKDLTKMYLQAAGSTFTGGGEPTEEAFKAATKEGGGSFGYRNEVMSGNTAVLEFEAEVAGKYVNGIDMITCNDEGKIVEFKVMIRPLQAVNLMHAQMKAMIEKMQG
ncbi:MAG: nuclear transport factor 2 family protein [Actinomycetota bacterium]|nr:nuclear transport factor 2 family protein [Actinomycetota bacterium]